MRYPLGRIVLPIGVAAATFWIAFDGGSYGLIDRHTLAVVAWWAIALGVALALWPLEPLPHGALVTGGLLMGFATWTGLSVLWAESEEKAFNELGRVLLYAGVFALVVLASRRARAHLWLEGLAAAIVVVGIVALSSRLFPDLSSEPEELAQLFPPAGDRLSYPVDYWNGLAALLALAFPLLLFLAVESRTLVVRGLALFPIPALAAAIYLASSRGAFAMAILGTLAFVLLAWRWSALGAAATSAIGAAAAISVLLGHQKIADDPFSPLAESQGRSAALLIVVVCFGTGLVYALGARYAPKPPRLPPALVWSLAALVVVALAAGTWALDPEKRFEAFKELGQNEANVREHLVSGSGSGRWQLWQAAVDEFESRPLVGRGAGSFEAWWAQHGSLGVFVRDAHSLYLETFAELGVVGGLLLLAALGSVLVAAWRRLRGTGPAVRTGTAALTAAFVAFLFEAGIDWMWELTAVSVVGVVCAALLVGPATLPPGGVDTPPSRLAFRAGGALIAMLCAAAVAVPLLAAVRVRDSQEAVQRGDADAALNAALDARSFEPWAASAHLQVALVAEQRGELPDALESIMDALEHDPSDWRLWLVAARLQTKSGEFDAARRSLGHVVALNPRSRLVQSLDVPDG